MADDGKRSEMPLGMNEVGRCVIDFVCFFFKEERGGPGGERAPDWTGPKGGGFCCFSLLGVFV